MPDERDPLDALRAAWKALEAPAPDAELDAPDARTEAAVSWMRAAWSALEAPAAAPVSAPRARHLFAGRPRRLAYFAVAAALALAALPALRRALESEPPREVAEAPRTMRLAALDRPDGAIEVREGPVRLLFVLPDPSPPFPSPSVPLPAMVDGDR